jgi:SAM-dependent methyltransferase
MSATDPGLPNEARLPSEERIHQAIVHGPDMSAGGRFGRITSVARRFVGRATKYERDFNLQVDGALLERIHDLEAATGQQIRDAEARLNGTDDLLRYADEVLREADQQLREADHRVNRDVSDLTERLRALETSIDELRSQMREVDTRATVASALAAGAAEGFAALSRPAPLSGGDIGAGPHVIAPPLVDHDPGTRPTPAVARRRALLEVIGDRGPVVDLGCGRGEMLELLAAAGIEAQGVDVDQTMVDRARAAGAEVHHGDALDFLMKAEDASFGAIFSSRLVEHLTANRLAELLEIARAKLVPGGLFIAETVNPHSPGTLKAFWVDPTHQHPLFPESMLALCRLTGFEAAKIMFPLGSGDAAADLRTCAEYAVIAGAVGGR